MIVSSILSDGMVLQRNADVKLGGIAEPYASVTVSFLGRDYAAHADQDGRWTVTLSGLEAGGPHRMTIRADEELVIRDILVGDVWLLGGQSNMELPVRRTLDRFADEIGAVNEPFIRQFAVPQTYDFHGPQRGLVGGKWIAATPDDVLNFSAAGFFFARAIYEKYGVPIGLLQAAVGGTPIEAWLSEPTLRRIGGYEAELDRCKDDDYVADVKRRDELRNERWHASLNEQDLGLRHKWHAEDCDTSGWREMALPASWKQTELEPLRGAVWFRKQIDVPAAMTEGDALLSLGTIVDADETYVNGASVGSTGYRYPPRRYRVPQGVLRPGVNTIAVRVVSTHNTGEFIPDMPYRLTAGGQELDLRGAWKYRVGAATDTLEPQTFFQYKPAGLYNGMIAPLGDYRIKGALWYQGESNTGRPQGYAELFRALTEDWRRNWGSGDFPFLYVQLANFEAEPDRPELANWAELREEQRRGLAVSNTAMAVAIDIGEHNDLHPQDKKTLGERLALCAQAVAYGEDATYSGPMFRSAERTDGGLRLRFDHVGGGLTARGGELRGFEVCGPDKAYAPAQAAIDGDTVIVRHDRIAQPVHARYAWANNPSGANLYNRDGLPASPFTTETD